MSLSQSSLSLPPLIGDSQGRYKIRVLGNSGSGKSTLSRQLATILDIPHLSLDEVYWQPGWKTTPGDELRTKMFEFMKQNETKGWVIDGDYSRMGGEIVQENATDVIWLDPPLLLYFPRVVLRTIRRLFGLEPPCSVGCPENIREVLFSKDSILWWCLSQHRRVFRRNSDRMKIWGLGVGSNPAEEQKMRRLGGWGSQVADWLESVRKLV
ncbi:AAA domain-containing protein [Lentinula raphanica]|uniref:AAA domain-containing protein n=1 Tax=Lentinula raphanica TaxID=153919 RepID=A0AA38P8G7_9AGAR|nr:AAA domain-containing protein [Lentinula raphanica]KAJ3820293.1 AAA domain-containing protein [Lentinula raphanica]KAJ3838254.1 AAA domain-containing protein [Lentinula raphanica]